MRKLAYVAALVPTFLMSAPLQAQEVVTGIGYSDFHNSAADSGGFLSADYLGARDWDLLGFETGAGLTVQLHEEGDVFLGVGLQGQRALRNDWFIEASIMPGLFEEGLPANDLGSTFEIRSLVGIGRVLPNGNRVSLALSHISNASVGDRNPGLNALSFRLHVPLSRGKKG